MSNDTNDYLKNKLKKEIALAKEKEEYYKEVYRALESDEKILDYFRGFEAKSVQEFKELYAQRKVSWRFNEYNQIEFKEKLDNRFHDYCVMALKNIQLKKLFNKVSEWMNEEVRFEDIKIYWDWIEWDAKPFSCPYITAIEEHEVQCYIDFLNQADYDFTVSISYISVMPSNFLEDNDNIGIKRWTGIDAEYNYGSWFKFFDERYHTGHYMLKPGTRGNKEGVYISRCHEERDKNNPPCQSDTPLPHISYYTEKENFVSLFEDADFKHLYRASKAEEEQSEFLEEIDMEIIHLTSANEIISIEDNIDWRKGVKNACEEYHRGKTIQLIWDVYDEYLTFLNVEEGFKGWEREGIFDDELKTSFRNQVLTGRKLMGEPEDFNY